ncbi:MAG: AbrB/MazE/SpoVT family DNA-binding domain-containing protein [Chloroflexi bacterium]|nr:MAG: AbrB/MazE/SpoVT family DNA-binding domain-containing protein [Chloroflexota bacterium]
MHPKTARLDRSGRLVLPVEVRRDLELREGDEVIFTAGESPHEVRLSSRRAAVDRAQALVRQYARGKGSVVEELLAERRRQAALEDRRHPVVKPRASAAGVRPKRSGPERT